MNILNLLLKRIKIFFTPLLIRVSGTGNNFNQNSNTNSNKSPSIELTPEKEMQLRDVSQLEWIDKNPNVLKNIFNESQTLTNKLDKQSNIFERKLDQEQLELIRSASTSDNSQNFTDCIIGIFKYIKKINNNIYPNVMNNRVTINNQNSNSILINESSGLTTKPLGEFGDMTLNEFYNKFLDIMNKPITEIIANPSSLEISAFALKTLTPLLIFKSLLASYNKICPMPKNIFSLSPEKQKILRREKQVVFFIAIPILTLILYNTKSPFSHNLENQGIHTFFKKQMELFIESLNNKDNLPEIPSGYIEEINSSDSEIKNDNSSISSISKSLSFFIFKGKIKLLAILFIIIIISILIYKIFNFNILYFIYNLLYNPTPIFKKYFLIVSILFSITFILRYIIFIISLYLIKNKKLTKSIFKPSFLNNFIARFERLAEDDSLEFTIDFYYKHLYIYIFLFLLSILALLLLLSNNI